MSAHKLFTVTGPSGVGKSTLVNRLVQALPELREAVSHTSRPPRTGETEGSPYHFIPKELFESMIRSGAFVEYVRYPPASSLGHYYGLTHRAVADVLKLGDGLAIVDGHGAVQLQKHFPCVALFLAPPAPGVLRDRLVARDDDWGAITARMASIGREMGFAPHADCIFEPDTAEATFARVARFIADHRRWRGG